MAAALTENWHSKYYVSDINNSPMITISEHARSSLRQILDQQGDYIGLRLAISGDIPGAYQPELSAMQAGDPSPIDIVFTFGGLKLYLDPESAFKAEGLKIDILSSVYGPRLTFDFPSPKWDDPVAARVQKLIDERINPGLANHGGYVALLDVQDGMAEILMGGGCQGCQLSAQTLSQGVTGVIESEIPEIHTVVDKTNHALGANPYFKSDEDQRMSKSARRRARRKRK